MDDLTRLGLPVDEPWQLGAVLAGLRANSAEEWAERGLDHATSETWAEAVDAVELGDRARAARLLAAARRRAEAAGVDDRWEREALGLLSFVTVDNLTSECFLAAWKDATVVERPRALDTWDPFDLDGWRSKIRLRLERWAMDTRKDTLPAPWAQMLDEGPEAGD